MKRSYEQGWAEVFGSRDLNQRAAAPKELPPFAEDRPAIEETPIVESEQIDWSKMRALSIRQPYAELILRGEKTTEYRSRSTKIRGRIAIYASLSTEDLEEAEAYGLDPERLPRGMIVGTVELYDSDGGDWYLRKPQRLAKPIAPTARAQPIWFYPFGRS